MAPRYDAADPFVELEKGTEAMPRIEGKLHGVFYGHGAVLKNKDKMGFTEGKNIIFYGPPQTTLADEVAKYVVLYLQGYPDVAPIRQGDLARISTANYESVRKANFPRSIDDLSPELWAAATVLADYPKVIGSNRTFPEVSISALESVSIYGLRPLFVTEFNHPTLLSEAIKATEFEVVHVTTCQAQSYTDDLVLLRPELSAFAARTRVRAEIREEVHAQTLEELMAEKVGQPSQPPSWNMGGVSSTPRVDPFANLGRGQPGLSAPSFGSPSFSSPSFGGKSSSFGSQAMGSGGPPLGWGQQKPPAPVIPVPKFACHNKACNRFESWTGETKCGDCNKDKYEVRYVCQNSGCPVYQRGQSEYLKTTDTCQYCGERIR